MEEIKVCMNIRKYIYQILSDDDDKLFIKRSMESLGKYLFAKIHKKISSATDELIKKTILGFSNKNSIENYFIELTNQVGIKILPKTALSIVKKAYLKVERKYQSYLQKANKKLDAIKDNMESINLSDIRLKSCIGRKNLDKDLRNGFSQLHYSFECREKLRTYQEIIDFDKNYIYECWLEEFGENLEINYILRQKAKSICTRNESILFDALIQNIQAAESNLQNELIVFYKAKFIPLREKIICENISKHISHEIKGEYYDVQEELKAIPLLQDIIEQRNKDKERYLLTLEKLFNDFSIVTELNNAISNIMNCKRKELLNDCISLFKDKKYNLLMNLLPVQIEGLFYDLLVDSTTYQLFTHLEIYEKPTLRQKLDAFHENRHIDIYEYFKYYFNNLIRNVAAHGRAISDIENKDVDIDIEVISYELMLDLNCILYYYIQKSEFVRMKILLQGFYRNCENNDAFNYKEMNFESMFATISRQRHISIFNFGVERFEPVQSIYWIFNPTYENKYSSIYGKEDLKVAREILSSIEFWLFVENKISQCIETGYNYEQIDKSFGRVLEILLGYVEKGPLKNSIIRVNRKLRILKTVDSEFNKQMNTIE